MATITKTQSGTWKAMIRRQGWPTTIKTFRLKRDAEDWARTTEDQMVRGLYVQRSHGERMTLDKALDRYLREVTPTKKSSTAAREAHHALPLREALGRYALAAITPDIVADYRDKRLATISPQTGRLLSASTVRLELALLGHLYSTAIREWGLGLTINPVQHIRRPKPSEGRNRRLTGDEERRLLAACDEHSNPMLGAVVRLALHTGMRQGEILSLTADQVDLDRRVVRLSMTKNGSARTVPLSRAAVDVLRDALTCPLRRGSPLVFPGEPKRGQAGRENPERGPYVINRVWAHALKRAGIEGLRFHDLRHEAVSRLVERGLSDQEVAAISGHKSMQMLRRYTHLRAEDLVEKLD
ncbi:tyrosine-type recombinase/integrase [Acidihalobacter prosperus]|uniref:Integrase n=1 Tax=Acidihalobacter prosperus TaxID=160660 RepID=A0A1A6C6T9_9GAMM|nr:site-specific integrase [Acidihalobacter prosperus]OBS10277.1 integrase [Acidihalobacter prosperus]